MVTTPRLPPSDTSLALVRPRSRSVPRSRGERSRSLDRMDDSTLQERLDLAKARQSRIDRERDDAKKLWEQKREESKMASIRVHTLRDERNR